MGYDVYGKNEPTYYRASVWTWRPLLAVNRQVNRIFKLGLKMDDWDYNQVDGLETQEECDRLAEAFRAWMENDWPKGAQVLELEVTPGPVETALVSAFTGAGFQVGGTGYRLTQEKALEWIDFLRSCGGFHIS